MTTLFGANWRTSLWGFITATALAISLTPTLTDFLPPSASRITRGIAGIIAAVSFGKFGTVAKDKDVTGGTVQQTAQGDVSTHSSVSVVDTKAAK